MPKKPAKPCAYPGCPRLTYEKYCDAHAEHEKDDARRYEAEDRDKTEHSRRYGRKWKKIRDVYMQSHPLCEMCKADGRLTAANEVHHKIPIGEGGTNDFDNLMALCSSCHAKWHAERGDRRGRRRQGR